MSASKDKSDDSVVLDPADAHDAAILSLAAWIQELGVRHEALLTADALLRQSGRYPQPDQFAALIDMAGRTERTLLATQPQLFGGIPPESTERQNVRSARANLENAQQGFARSKELLRSMVDHDSGEYRSALSRCELWGRDLVRYRQDLSRALRACPGLSPQEMRESAELVRQLKEEIVISI